MQFFQPMPLLKRAAPFDDPDWIYELKMDGFRALAVVEHGRAQLISQICCFTVGIPCFFAFDLLTYGKDLRTERLLDHLDGSAAGNPNSGYAILGHPIREHFTLTA